MHEVEVDLKQQCAEDDCPFNDYNEQCWLAGTAFRDSDGDHEGNSDPDFPAAPHWCPLRDGPVRVCAKRGQAHEGPDAEGTMQVTLWWKTRRQEGSPLRPKLGLLLMRAAAWLVHARVRVLED